jgi:hypothetical protein
MSGLTGSSTSSGRESNPQGRAAAAGGSGKQIPKVEYNLEYQDRFQKFKELSLPTRMVKARCKMKVKLSWNHAIKQCASHSTSKEFATSLRVESRSQTTCQAAR